MPKRVDHALTAPKKAGNPSNSNGFGLFLSDAVRLLALAEI